MPHTVTAKIAVIVQPNASQNRLVSFQNGVWHLRVTAPPAEGKANRELIAFLSKLLGISKSQLTIEKGLTSRHKLIAISGLTQEQAESLLRKALG